MLRFVLLLAAFASLAAAQARYTATTGDVSLSAAGTKFTIQQPATSGRLVKLETAVVYCSVACDVTQTHSGAAATATAGTTSQLPPSSPSYPAASTVWTASNVGAGTAASGISHMTAGQSVVFDLSKITLGPGAGTASNYTIVVSTITGTANITLYWGEK